MDEYFSGSKDRIRRAGVVYILDTVYEMLDENPLRTFTWVEVVHFTKWWRV